MKRTAALLCLCVLISVAFGVSTEYPLEPIFAVPPAFDAVSKFSEGLAAVSVNGRWGFIKNPLT